MLALVTALVLGAPPAAEAGPDLVERAVAVDLPIRDVMVFSDRARVTRRASVPLKGGVSVWRAPDLPGATIAGSVRVSAQGASVVRVETSPIERERFGIEQVDEWIKDIERETDALAAVEGKLAAVRAEIDVLDGVAVAPPLPEKDRLQKPLTPAPDAWRDAVDRIAARRRQLRERERALELGSRAVRASLAQKQREVQAKNIGGFSEVKLQVLVILDGAGPADVTLEYAVPGAFWKPAYDLAFDPDKGSVRLMASGLVTQATGEDWSGVTLRLSTAIPGLAIDLPALRTWTLGDDREYVPQPTARSTPRTAAPFQPPTPRPRVAELERDADRALLAARTALLVALAADDGLGASGGGAAVGRKTTIDFSEDTIEGDFAKPEAQYITSRSKRSPRSPPPAPPPSPAMAPMPGARPRDFEREEMTTMAVGSQRGASGPAQRRARLAMLSGQAWVRPSFGDPLLPAVSAGGFDYVYAAPLPATVPANASGLKVPLDASEAKADTFYEATPSLSPTAYLKAVVKNGAALPILAGPANVFVKGTFAGDAQLATTGPGGELELPLGADEDLRLTRTVIPQTRTQGFVFGEEDITDYAVTIEVANYKKAPVTVRVIDQLPKTNSDKIKVTLAAPPSPPAKEPADGDGLLYWHVDLDAGKTKKITFSYRISRPKGWRLRQ